MLNRKTKLAILICTFFLSVDWFVKNPRPAYAYTSLFDAAIARYPISPVDFSFNLGKTDIDWIITWNSQYDIINWSPFPWYDTQLDSSFPRWDDVVDYLYTASRNGRGSYKSLITVVPRFSPTSGLSDRRHDGTTIVHDGQRCPDYTYIDLWDPSQVQKFNGYITKVAQRYANNPAIAGFFLGWGYYGENGYDYGGGCGNDGVYASRDAGYSVNAINAFKNWASSQGLGASVSAIDPNVPATWGPILPSVQDPQPLVYSQWIYFHTVKIREFQQSMISAAKTAAPEKQVGIFDYLNIVPSSYARGWVDTPNADFFSSQFITGSQYYTKAIPETDVIFPGIGPNPAGYNRTPATVPWNWYRIQMVREIARGAGAMAFYRRDYQDSGLYRSLSAFLGGEFKTLRSQIVPEQTRVALFIPTWSAASMPSAGGSKLFEPTQGENEDVSDSVYYINLLESLGVNFDVVREDDLLDHSRIDKYQVIFIPALRYFIAAIGDTAWNGLNKGGMYGIYNRGERMSQAQMRQALIDRGVPDSSVHITGGNSWTESRALVGLFNGIIYNFSDQSRTITLRYANITKSVTIEAYTYLTAAQALDSTNPKGYFDGAFAQTPCTVYGWTCDPDSYATALRVQLLENNAVVGTVTANVPFEAPAECGNTGNHRFSYTFPAGDPIRNNGNHVLSARVIGINAKGEETVSSPLTPSSGANLTVYCPILQTSPTPTPTPTTRPILPGDLNADGKVDIFDYNLLVSNFGKTGTAGFIPADINKDGKVDIFDYNILVTNFGR